MNDLDWTCCDGGPHLFIASELVPLWQSTDDEYKTACAIQKVGVVPIGSGGGLVLGGDVPMSAWISTGAFSSGTLVVPLVWQDDELTADLLHTLISRVPATSYTDTGLTISSATGGFSHFAACDSGPEWVYGVVAVPLPAGCYRIFTTDADVDGYLLRLHGLKRDV